MPLSKQATAARFVLQATTPVPAAGTATLGEIADRQGQLLNEQLVMQTRNQSQMRDILTDEQRSKLKTLLQEHRR